VLTAASVDDSHGIPNATERFHMYDFVGLESTWVALGRSTWPTKDTAEVQA
jgi:hypothetical protein